MTGVQTCALPICGGSGKGYVLGVVAPVAGWSIGAHYARQSESLVKTTAWELFANKEIFKNTYGYIEFGDWKNSTDGGEGVVKTKAQGYAAGVIFVF